jgi:hypothetical protein
VHRLARWMMGALCVIAVAGIAAAVLSPVWPGVHPAITTAAVALALLGLHLFLRYCERRGWIYYTRGRGSYGGLGATSDFLNMYDPSRKHLQQTAREHEWKRDEDDDGDQPKRPG